MGGRATSGSARSAGSAPGLSIGDVAERSGVPVTTLRTWESRYGVPRPVRLPSGHRRYADSDVALVQEILRLRTSGVGLTAAIGTATDAGEAAEPSLFAALRRRHPGLQMRTLHKRTLLALTRAVEDECITRADRPLLFAGFQRQEAFRQSRDRWVELSRTAEAAFVFADFPRHSAVTDKPVRLALAKTAPLRREWLLVCEDSEQPACVIGSEMTGQGRVRDENRRFETIWTLDPRVVRDAARVCATMAVSLKPQVESRLGDRLRATAPEASSDLRRAQGVFERVVSYLDSPR